MFIVYAVLAGVVVGFLLGGRLENLGHLRIRGWPIAFAALAIQLVLFTDAGSSLVGAAAPAIYLGSTAAVLAVVVWNIRIPGLALVALGAASNLLAIIANGGVMPADPGAMASLGEEVGPGYSNSAIVADPVLRPLTDIFAMPAWMPLANVFSIGDVLIGIGIAIAIAAGMRGQAVPTDTASPRPPA